MIDTDDKKETVSKNDRVYPRIDFIKPLEYSFDKNTWYKGLVLNLSDGGMFISGDVLARPGAKIFIKIESANNELVRLIGEVKWVRTKKSKNDPGMGVSLVSYLADGESLVSEFVPDQKAVSSEHADSAETAPPKPTLEDLFAELSREPSAAEKSGLSENSFNEKTLKVQDNGDYDTSSAEEGSTDQNIDFYKSLEKTRLGSFSLASMLGFGAMGAVYHGKDENLHREVAVKVLAPQMAVDRIYIKQFLNEARAASSLNHPNIAQIYTIGQKDNIFYYVMEFVEGPTLSELLEKKKVLSGFRTIDYMIMTAEGLDYAFRKGIIHRDIKPANLMINSEDSIKIVDFGLAKFISKDSALTQAGVSLGTPFYMSPEQGLGVSVDFRSDIYSLGATFYHLYTGTPPFEGENNMATIIKHIKEPLVPLKDVNPRVPQEICSIIEKCLAKEPEDRFNSYGELIAALKAVKDRKGKAPENGGQKPLPKKKGVKEISRLRAYFNGFRKKS